MTDIPKDLGKNADRSYDVAPTVHPDAVSGGGKPHLKDGEIITHLRDGRVVQDAWVPVTRQLPPPHKTVLARSDKGDIYQARICYGMHVPWWCGHSELNFGVVLQDKGITIKEWRHLG